ncbi:MAG: YhcH/YjgK/YiaL family protein [Bacteroidales bacterium]|jgi:YhcH/YjgK/YiaL family protein|nr:YhcH/YjgK/YiaL family protein [Bacteroidales bacterium]
MKKIMALISIMFSALLTQGCKTSSNPIAWNDKRINKWFESREYLNGWNVIPDSTIEKREFAIAYFKDKDRWDRAFDYLKTTDLQNLEVARHYIDSTNLFALVTEYTTQNEDELQFEAHKKYIDIQYIISGIEQIGIASVSKKEEILMSYDETRDVEFMTVSESSNHEADPCRFFIFFPHNLHRPNIKSGEISQVKKIVMKIKL